MVENDVPTVVEIDKDSFVLSWPASSFHYELTENPVAALFVAAVGKGASEEIVGYIGLWELIDEGHISTLAVKSGYRRRGIAEALLQRAFEHLASRGINEVTLEVRKSNHMAQALYKKHGFQIVGVRSNYYSDNGEDALMMTVVGLAERQGEFGS
jgi:ribosomal-protein-alanine N-acetyltransferase